VQDDAGGGGTGRSRPRWAWGAAGAALAAAVFALALLAHGGPAARQASAARAAAAHAMPPAMAACERSRVDCDPAARDVFPLDRPMAPGARPLTEQQVVGRASRRGDTVRARLMTYGQAASAFPGLAASAVIARSREVWVLTVYFAEPVLFPVSGPPGTKAARPVSAMSEVIDATTGKMTDECLGCAVIPRSG
jgi:hypothetical protein